MKEKMAKLAGAAFIVALLTIDSPVWFIAFIAIAVMAIATFKGQLWNFSAESEDKNE